MLHEITNKVLIIDFLVNYEFNRKNRAYFKLVFAFNPLRYEINENYFSTLFS